MNSSCIILPLCFKLKTLARVNVNTLLWLPLPACSLTSHSNCHTTYCLVVCPNNMPPCRDFSIHVWEHMCAFYCGQQGVKSLVAPPGQNQTNKEGWKELYNNTTLWEKNIHQGYQAIASWKDQSSKPQLTGLPLLTELSKQILTMVGLAWSMRQAIFHTNSLGCF